MIDVITTDKMEDELDIKAPLIFWVTMLLLGVILELVILPLLGSVAGGQGLNNTISSIAGYILYLPGSVIFPLIVSIWIGEKVGQLKRNIGSSASIGFVNAVYAALLYLVAIFIIYLLVKYITPTFLATVALSTFIEYAIVVPVVIVIVLVPIVAALSAARHSNM